MVRPATKVRLYTTDSPGAAWDHVVADWLEGTMGAASAVVVTPNRPVANALKSMRLSAGGHLFGTRFLLPGALRTLLTRLLSLDAAAAKPHDLDLVATLAASTLDTPAARSIARSPRGFVRFRQQLAASGWSDEDPQRRPIIQRFDALRASLGWRLDAEIDRDLLTAASEQPPHVDHLLVVGFDSLHWQLFPLLAAAVRTAASATVILSQPHTDAQEPDELWMGTWEEAFGAAEIIPSSETQRPFADLLEPSSASGPAREDIDFIVGEDVGTLARAVAATALTWLAEENEPRIGIVFPEAGPLARLVSQHLAEAGIIHADQFGHRQPGTFEEPSWNAWVRLQESHRPAALVALARNAFRLGDLFADATPSRLDDVLSRAREQYLFGDLATLTAFLRRSDDPFHVPIADGLAKLVLLPERATPRAFLDATRRSFQQMAWDNRLAILDEAKWIARMDGEISRRAWLDWLGETLSTWTRGREPSGSQPYSRVQLVSAEQAESQEWTHILLCGLNEGEWPPRQEESAWLSEPEIVELNQRAVRLNERAVQTGIQGEGHRIVTEGHTLWLTPAHRRAIASRQLTAIIENTSTRVAAAAALHDEREPSRVRQPGEFFMRLHMSARGRPVGTETMRALAVETSRWLQDANVFTPPAAIPLPETSAAWRARRDATRPFGEYEFARGTKPAAPLLLSASDLENALKRPAELWLKHVLHVQVRAGQHDDITSRVVGKWAHNWLASAAGRNVSPLQPHRDTEELVQGVRKAADSFQSFTSALLATLGRDLPDWWISIWREALAPAVASAEHVGALKDWPFFVAEYDVGRSVIGHDTGFLLHTKGRIDLLLSSSPSPTEGTLLVIDYKTGSREPLTLPKLEKGDGIQLALYVLALRAQGCAAQGASRVGPQLPLADTPQVLFDDLVSLDGLWSGLSRMEESAIFGWRGPLRNEYGVTTAYPLATLAVDPDILEAKWALSHPDLNGEGTE